MSLKTACIYGKMGKKVIIDKKINCVHFKKYTCRNTRRCIKKLQSNIF